MDAEKLIHNFNKVILNPVILVLFAVALLVFVWGVFEYFRSGDSETSRELGKRHILWGLVGLAVMMSAFGILNIALGTFGISAAPVRNLIP